MEKKKKKKWIRPKKVYKDFSVSSLFRNYFDENDVEWIMAPDIESDCVTFLRRKNADQFEVVEHLEMKYRTWGLRKLHEMMLAKQSAKFVD